MKTLVFGTQNLGRVEAEIYPNKFSKQVWRNDDNDVEITLWIYEAPLIWLEDVEINEDDVEAIEYQALQDDFFGQKAIDSSVFNKTLTLAFTKQIKENTGEEEGGEKNGAEI